jgi:hypothetical protein
MFINELTDLINKYSLEKYSNDVLIGFNNAIKERDEWYNIKTYDIETILINNKDGGTGFVGKQQSI